MSENRDRHGTNDLGCREPLANPDVSESEEGDAFRVLSLDALVRINLTAFRDKDRTHLRDLIEVGLLDAGWLARLPSVLVDRLRRRSVRPRTAPQRPPVR